VTTTTTSKKREKKGKERGSGEKKGVGLKGEGKSGVSSFIGSWV
jgi:hypothetical protein